MKRLTIIIPYHHDPATLEETILSLLENRPEESEILVVLNRPYENPYELQEDEVRFVQNPKNDDSDLSSIQTGVAASDSEFVQVLPSGAKVSEGWASPAMEQLADRSSLGAILPSTSMFWGLFFRKSVFEVIGGFDSRYGENTEMTDFVQKLNDNGWDYLSLPSTAMDIPAGALGDCHADLLQSMANASEKLDKMEKVGGAQCPQYPGNESIPDSAGCPVSPDSASSGWSKLLSFFQKMVGSK